MRIYKKTTVFNDHRGIDIRRHKYVNTVENEHTHEFIELVYISNGNGIHGIGGTEYKVTHGSLVFINYQQTHYFKTDTEMELYNILLDPEWISEKLVDTENIFELLTLSSFSCFQQEINTEYALIRFKAGERTALERLISEIQSEIKNKNIGYDTVLKAQTNILLTMIFRKLHLGNGENSKICLDSDFLNYIKDHCFEKLTLESLSKKCFYNPSYFSRVFREHYGMTLTEFINQSRLEKSMDLLKDTALSVEEISDISGFGNRSAFYKSFKARTGFTPYEYRKNICKK